MQRRAFTLVEILIVIVIFAVIMAVAYPAQMRAREGSRATACQGNLKEINSAKERWGLEKKATSDSEPTMSDIVGPDQFMKAVPVCPSGGKYTVGKMSDSPTCCIGVNEKHPDWSHSLWK